MDNSQANDGSLPARATECALSLRRMVSWWDGDSMPYAAEEELWGKILRDQALDLGLRSAWDLLPKPAVPCPLSQIDEILAILERRGVDAGQCYMKVEEDGSVDIYLMAPKAFPGLGIMADPDPRKVGLLR